MTHEHAFRQAIAESPDEDTQRLVYADWLDERGDPAAAARAEFIRTQIALERAAEDDDRRWGLESRAQSLLSWYGKGWCGRLRRLVKRWQFRRGFVEAVTLPAADFLRHAEELFRLAPLRHVRLLDAREHLPELVRCPYLSRLRGLDLRHTPGLDAPTLRPLLDSPHLRLEYLGLRGTGLCSGPGLRALADCPRLAGLTALDLSDHRYDRWFGRRTEQQRRSWVEWRRWRQGPGARPIDAGAMRALVESPCMTGLRSLGLAGHGQTLHREAFDCLLSSRLLAGLRDLDLSLAFIGPGIPGRQGYEGVDLFELLGRSSRSAGLRALRLRRVGSYYHPWRHLPRGSHLAGLTTLELQGAFPSPEWMHDLAGGALPGLVALRLWGSWMVDYNSDYPGQYLSEILTGARGLPQLALLDLRQSPVGPEGVRALAEGPLLPGLRWLSLANRGGYVTAPLGPEAVRTLAAAPGAARLVHLDLGNNRVDDDTARALAASPHLAGLASLSLWHNQIGTAGAAALATSMPALTALDLRANPLPAETCRRLRQRFGPGVRYGPMRRLAGGPDPDEVPF